MLPNQELKEMKRMLSILIDLNRSLQKNQYRALVLYQVPKKNVRVPYKFYLN